MKFGDIDGFWWKDEPKTVPFEIKVINSEGDSLDYTFTEDNITPDILIETNVLL